MPTDTQIADGFEKAANGLEKAIPLACTNEVDMREPSSKRLGKGHSCGTACCHGGWLAFAHNKGCFPSLDIGVGVVSKWYYYGDLYHGGTVLSSLCGFQQPHEFGVAYWAMDNPEAWGNHYAEKMFSDSNEAFDDKKNLTIENIIAHYRAVAARLRERVACAEKAKRDRKLRESVVEDMKKMLTLPQAEKAEVAY